MIQKSEAKYDIEWGSTRILVCNMNAIGYSSYVWY